MTVYRQKPPTVEAVQWTGDLAAVQVLFPDASTAAKDQTHCLVPVTGGTGHFRVPMGSWITIDPSGVMNYMPDENFVGLYEEIA